MKKFGLILFLCLAVGAVYWPVKDHQFVVVDDHIHITENPHFVEPNLKSLANFWKGPYEGLYIPVTYTAWGALIKLNHRLYGKSTVKPVLFHLSNLALHAVNTCLVFVFLSLFTESLMAAFAGAALFGLHLAQVESVAWVSGFKDVLSTFFGLLCLLSFYRQRFWMATAFYLTAILSKPSMIALPFVITCLEWGIRKAPIGQTLKKMGLWLALAIPVVVITQASQSEQTMKYITPFWQRPFIATDALIFYLGKTFAPFFSVADYSRTPQKVLATPWAYVAWMALLLIFLLLRNQAKHWRILLIGFCLSLLPVLGLIPFSYQFFSTVADRYLYFPMVVVALAAAFLYSHGTKRVQVLLGLLLFALGLVSHQQVQTWKHDRALFTHTLRFNSVSLLGTNNLGTLYENEGDLDTAEKYYRRALRINPQAYPAMYNLARTLGRKGHSEEALALFLKLLAAAPGIAEAQFSVGLIYTQANRPALAIPYFKRAANLEPNLVKAHYYLGTVLLETKHIGFAREAFQNALNLSPVHLGALYGLAECDMKEHQYESAKKHLLTLQALEPKSEKVRLQLAKIDNLR